jgi:hypothetical protein
MPVGWMVRGLLAEPSTAGGFYLWDVRLPLYIPTDVVVLNWSTRVGGGSRVWSSQDAANVTMSAGENVREAAESQSSILLSPPGGADSVNMQEAKAYGLVLEGSVPAAVEVLSRVLTYVPTYEWELERYARASTVRTSLLNDDVATVLSLLGEWRRESAKLLRIVGLS